MYMTWCDDLRFYKTMMCELWCKMWWM